MKNGQVLVGLAGQIGLALGGAMLGAVIADSTSLGKQALLFLCSIVSVLGGAGFSVAAQRDDWWG